MKQTARSRRQWTEHLEQQLERAPVGERPKVYHKQTPSHIEHDIQAGFITAVDLMIPQVPELAALYAIPNGGNRHPAVGAKLKAEGVRRGVPDLHLPVARGGFHSLYLETKCPDKGLSGYQAGRIRYLRELGNCVLVCYSITELLDAVMNYLNGEIIRDEPGSIASDR